MAVSLIAPMTPSLIQPVAFSLMNAITGKGVMRAGKGQKGGFFPLLAFPLMMKFLGKRFRRTGRGYNSVDRMDNNF